MRGQSEPESGTVNETIKPWICNEAWKKKRLLCSEVNPQSWTWNNARLSSPWKSMEGDSLRKQSFVFRSCCLFGTKTRGEKHRRSDALKAILLNVSLVSLSRILCPTDFFMVEIIYNDRMSLRHSAIGHFIVNKGAVIFPGHLLGFFPTPWNSCGCVCYRFHHKATQGQDVFLRYNP